MKHLIYILVFFFIGCNTIEKPKKPENLISKENMADIMYDVFLLNSAKGVNKKVLEMNGIFPENYVFEKYKIDSTQFANSNNYYAYDVKTYQSIINSVKEKIDLKKQEYEALDKLEELEKQRISDSIRAYRAKINDSLIKAGNFKRPIKVNTKDINSNLLEN
jgi:hypothetical protein